MQNSDGNKFGLIGIQIFIIGIFVSYWNTNLREKSLYIWLPPRISNLYYQEYHQTVTSKSNITKLYPVRVLSPNCMKTVSVSTDNCNNPLPGENTTSCHSTSSSRTSDEPLSSDHSLTNYCVCVIITIVSVVVRQDVVLW